MANDLTRNHEMGLYSKATPVSAVTSHEWSPGAGEPRLCVSMALYSLLRPALAKGRQMAENRVAYLIYIFGL